MAFLTLMYYTNIGPCPNTFQKVVRNANLEPSTWNSISTHEDIMYLSFLAYKECLNIAKLSFFTQILEVDKIGDKDWCQRHGLYNVASSRQNLRTLLLVDFLPLHRSV